MAGASLCATRFKGKLNGVIASTGPQGNLRDSPHRPAEDGIRSRGNTSPPIRVDSSAATRNVRMARSTSARAALIGLPASRIMVCANCSCCDCSRVATAAKIFCFSHDPVAEVFANPSNRCRNSLLRIRQGCLPNLADDGMIERCAHLQRRAGVMFLSANDPSNFLCRNASIVRLHRSPHLLRNSV